MATVLVRHRVGDFDTWQKGHHERLELFASAVSSYRAFQDMNDPSVVSVVMEVFNLELLTAIISDPNNQDFKNQQTILEPISISKEVVFC